MILHLASQVGLTGKGYVWIASQSVVGDLSESTSQPGDEFLPIGLMGLYLFILLS